MYDDWGISEGYRDVAGTWHPTPEATRDRLRAAMGDVRPGPPIWFVVAGTSAALQGPCELVLEDGSSLGTVDALPHDVPLGYHLLVPVDGSPSCRLVVHPPTCPPLPRAWGVAAQVYALWSERSWGIGDLHDVRTLAERMAARGGEVLLLSPLHQPAPTLPQEASPYYPSTRRAWNPLLIGIDALPPLRLRAGSGDPIDRDEAWIAKRSVLEAEFDVLYDADPASLPEPSPIATWNAWCDVLHPNWRAWPDPLPAPDPDHRRRAVFHEWLQARVAAQLDAVNATGVALIGDLAVGFGPDGADAHEYAHLLALDMRIGAPPDEFNTAGQEWGIPPFVPWKLRADWYRPFIDTVRACLVGMAGLRIDHVMGLFRQYWVPEGGSPRDGAYVRFPADELLAIICLEATRAGAFVVGEDLGTVEQEVRDELARRQIAGTKVLWFEDGSPSAWPEGSLATVTTHDLPTIAGVFARPAGDPMRDRLTAAAPFAATSVEARAAANAAVLASASRLRLLTTDDLAGALQQPNLPGTVGGATWCTPLPCSVDELL